MPTHDHGTPKILRPYLIPQDEERYPIEPRKIPAPVPEPGILDAPYYCLRINHLWFVHLLGVIDVLANRDTWEGDSTDQQRALDQIELFLSQLNMPCSAGDCIDIALYDPRIEWQPNDPFRTPDLVPDGYLFPPWYIAPPTNLIGASEGDIVTDIARINAIFGWHLTYPLPRLRLSLTGKGVVRIYFVSVFLGGYAQVQIDGIIGTLRYIDLERNVGFPGETSEVIIWEYEFTTEGDHFIDVSAFPSLAAGIPIGFGMGVRRITLCGFGITPECPDCPDCPDCQDCPDDDDCGCGCDDDETPEEPDDCADCGCDDDEPEEPEEPEVPEEDEEMFIGTIIAYASGKAPVKAGQKWVACDGDDYPQVEYPEFHAEFTDLQNDEFSFHVPDLRDRFILGLGTGDVDEEGGAATHTLTEAELPSHTHLQNAHTHVQDAHTHTQNAHTHVQDAHNHTQAAHSHSLNAGNAAGSTANTVSRTSITAGTVATDSQTPTINNTTAVNQNATATNQNTTAVNQNATATNQNTGGGTAHNNMPPYLTLGYYIRIK